MLGSFDMLVPARSHTRRTIEPLGSVVAAIETQPTTASMLFIRAAALSDASDSVAATMLHVVIADEGQPEFIQYRLNWRN